MLCIRGATYYDPGADWILIPHYSGDYRAVDCDQYAPMGDLKQNYDKAYIRGVVKDYPVLTYRGTKYYYAEWGPNSTDGLILLSDLTDFLSNLYFEEDEVDFD